MDNFSGGSSGEGGYPGRSNNSSNGSRVFNPLLMERGAAAPLPPTFSNTNGMILQQGRPSGGTGAAGGSSGGIALSSSESNSSNNRTQQPHHEVFMVREASRSNILSSNSTSAAERSFSGGQPVDPVNFSGGEHLSSHITSSTASNLSSTTSNRHHRSSSERGGGGGGGGEKENKQLILPRMLKIAVVGESTSGKTGICNAFTSEGYSFSRNYHMTTGVSIYAKSIRLPSGGGGGGEGDDTVGNPSSSSSSSSPEDILEPRINLVLVDSAGKPLYRELLPQYWDQLDGLALVIDLTSSTALETAPAWFNLVKECLKVGRSSKQSSSTTSDETGDQSGGNKRGGLAGSSPTLGVLIGSKNDLKDQRVISPKAAQDFAAQHGLQYFECSAKENGGIEEPFFYLAHQWARNNTIHGHDKDNIEREGNSTSAGIFAAKSNAQMSSSASRKSAFASRQSSSEAF